ncbi:hypothetical protein RRG08_018112 [Elysia crispata]|uniref:EF-hand domain-containing protein n=1 Tax=Elysia crispata TaxID=231223 RepID=A0AAE0ZDJ7_9GAST|nr:hypothetical protein RRG08_018112 [Elysia crispata]
MSTGQAVFIRSMPDSLAAPCSEDPEAAHRRPSFLSTYSFGQKDRRETIDTTASQAVREEKEREDDLETVLDTSIDAKPYDESGKRTYERACVKMGVTPISCCLRQLESAQTLDLSFYGLSARGVIPVAMALMINSNITRLLLPGNSLGVKGFNYIQKMMEDNGSIVELDLSSNNLLTEGMLAVVEMLKTNKSLIDLNLGDNGFVESDSYALAKALENNGRLQTLNLSKNHFGDESAHAFSHMIAENTGLQDLDLSWNHFRNKGGKYLAKGLGENPALKRLDLSWNGLEDEGATALGKALSSNGVLVEIDLSCNRIGPKGALELLKCFRSNDSLEILRIGKNIINDESATAMMAYLMKLTGLKLQLLDMSDIILSSAIEPRIQEVKDLNEGLEIVHGYTDSYGKRKLVSYDMTEEAIRIMQEYCNNNNMSMVDMFTKFDADGSMSVTHDEFRQGLKEAKIPLSANQIDQLIADLDRDGDGEIDFSELVITTEEKTGD